MTTPNINLQTRRPAESTSAGGARAKLSQSLTRIARRALFPLRSLYRRAGFELFYRKVSAQDKTPAAKVGEPVDSYVAELRREGLVVLHDFFTAEQVARLRAGVDCVLEGRERIEKGRFAPGVARLVSDHGSFRIWNVNLLSDEVDSLFTENPVFNRLAEAYYHGPVCRESTIYQETHPSEKDRYQLGSGRQGFHFDNVYRTLKIFLYLEDVTAENGPFTYVRGSTGLGLFDKRRKMRDFYLENYGLFNGVLAAYYTREEEELFKLWERATPVTGKAGTVILADTRGLHVAGEVTRGRRRAIVNSYRSPSMPKFPALK